MRIPGFILFLLLGSLVPASSQAEQGAQIDFSGFVDTYHSVQLKSANDIQSSRTRLRLELRTQMENASLFASVNAEKNYILSDETGVDLHEAFLDYISDSWAVRIGRQIIIWGKADGIQITDIICPPDYTEFITRDLDEIRMPVDALKFRWLGNFGNAEVIWIPVFEPAVLPEDDNPWAITPVFPDDVDITFNSTKEPEKTLKNSEIAGKLSFYLSGIDIALSALYTWDDFPSMHRTVERDGSETLVTFEPEHHRLTVFGLEFSKPWGEFVFRGEAAFYKGRYFEPENLADELFKRNSLNWLVGADWYPGNNWTIILQFADILILDYDDRIEKDEHAMIVTLNVTKKLLRETLTLSNMIYYSINDKDLLDRISVEYALTDEFHIFAGADFFSGDEKSSFGVYEDNTQVWIKAKYSF
jgi:hypothetical protein